MSKPSEQDMHLAWQMAVPVEDDSHAHYIHEQAARLIARARQEGRRAALREVLAKVDETASYGDELEIEDMREWIAAKLKKEEP